MVEITSPVLYTVRAGPLGLYPWAGLEHPNQQNYCKTFDQRLCSALNNFSKGEAIADILTMADEAVLAEEAIGPAESPLVAVSFQKNVRRKEKYLEAEPKALGITQIGLSVFQISCVAVLLSKGMSYGGTDVPFFIATLMLRACLGMQIVACGACIVNFICSVVKMDFSSYMCWYYDRSPSTPLEEICQNIERANTHFMAEIMVIQAALFAISATLAAYCCKVVNCCSPAPRMPVITVHASPPVQ